MVEMRNSVSQKRRTGKVASNEDASSVAKVEEAISWSQSRTCASNL